MIQVTRCNTFETNSSSTHSLTLEVRDKEYNLIFNKSKELEYGETFNFSYDAYIKVDGKEVPVTIKAINGEIGY